jgi:hypothetical protein
VLGTGTGGDDVGAAAAADDGDLGASAGRDWPAVVCEQPANARSATTATPRFGMAATVSGQHRIGRQARAGARPDRPRGAAFATVRECPNAAFA